MTPKRSIGHRVRIVNNILSLLSSGIVVHAVSFFVVVYLARVLGPDGFGRINFAFAIVGYFMLFTDMGIGVIATREVAGGHYVGVEKLNRYVGNIIALRLTMAVVSFVALVAIALMLDKPAEIKSLIILYGAGVFVSSLFIEWLFQGLERMHYIALGRIAGVVVYAGGVFSLIRNPQQLLIVACLQFLAGVVTAGCLFWSFRKIAGKIALNIDMGLWKTSLRQALPIGVAVLMNFVINNANTVMLGFMSTESAVGYFNSAFKLLLPLSMLGSVYFDAIYPVITRHYAGVEAGAGTFGVVLSLSARVSITLLVPTAVGGTMLAGPLMHLIYGGSYDAASTALGYLLWAGAIGVCNMVYIRGLWASARQGLYLRVVLVQAIVSLLLNAMLIGSFAIVGCAITALVVEALGLLLYVRAFRDIATIAVHRFILKPVVASAIMALFLYTTSGFNIAIEVLGGALVYIVSLYLIKGITRDELSMIYRGISGL
ncbi:MAG: oligosaccharide flippase family protein [Candidatus Magnetobacterium sp. LHC-1]|nr:oligosaccharide flippase family protein [Nitrospirota bacterium]